MSLHADTIFLVALLCDITLGIALSVAGAGRNRSLSVWGVALFLHAAGVGLLAARSVVPEFASVVLGNVALSACFAVLTDGLLRFEGTTLPRWRTWWPVLLLGFALGSLRGDEQFPARVVVTATIFAGQGGTLANILWRGRPVWPGRGAYIVLLGMVLVVLAFGARAIAAAWSPADVVSFDASSALLRATMLAIIMAMVLTTLGVVVMTKERAETILERNRRFTQGILDSVPSRIAVLDGNGKILDVNLAWRRHASREGLPAREPDAKQPGDNYLAALGSFVDRPLLTAAAAGIRSVLAGEAARFSQEYAWPPGESANWYELSVTPLSTQRGVVVTHYDITARKQAENEVRRLAYIDTLTQLPNRRLLDDRLTRATAESRRSGLFGALLLIDLDNFKPVNDTWGHDAGDALLQEAARRLSRAVREVDTVARLGGDEFAVLLGGLGSESGPARALAAGIAEKVRQALCVPYRLAVPNAPGGVVEHICSASIGIAVFAGDDASRDELLKRADIAMYQAKTGGRDAVAEYDV